MKKKGKLGHRELEHRFHVWVLVITHCHNYLKHITKWGAICFLGYLSYLSIKELAGKTTIAEAAISFAAKVRVSEWAAWLSVAILSLACKRMHNSKQKLQRDNLTRMAELESLIDPDRTSSGLDEDGKQPSEDVI